jgi:hypothetical protein
VISTDESTPRNPNKPRLSRRLLSHFTLTLSVLLALSFVTLAVVGPTTQETEAIAPLIIGGVIVAAAVAGFIGGWLAHQSDEAKWESGAQAYADSLGYGYNTAASYSKAAIYNDLELFDRSLYKYVRFAEYAALQLYNDQAADGQAFEYDSEYVLRESGIIQEITYFTEYADLLYSNLTQQWDNLPDTFVGDFDGMAVNAYIYRSSYGVDISADHASLDMVKMKFTNHFIGGNIYVSNTSELCLINPTYYNVANATATITNSDNEVVYSYYGALNKGQSKTFTLAELGLPSGEYKFGKALYLYWTGPAAPALVASGGIIPSMVIYKGDAPRFILYDDPYSTNFKGVGDLTSGAGEQNYDLNSVYMRILNDGNSIWSSNVATRTIFDYKVALLANVSSMLTTINNFAQTKYNAIVAQGGMNLPDPSVVFPNLDNLEGYTWQEIYAIYIAYLNAMEERFQNYSSMGPDNVNISAESLKLKIKGSILDNTGNKLAGNTTIFTPFISYGSEFLELGPNTWNSAGWVMIWGNGTCDNISAPTLKYMELARNYTLNIEQIMYDGVQVEEIALTVDRLSLILPENQTPPDPPESDSTTDTEWLMEHWYYFAIIAGIICMLAAISLRNTAVILVGVVLLAAGGIGYWMAGDFSLFDVFGLSMEPENLRAWLQGLR